MEREESFGDLTLKLNLLKIRGSQNTLLALPIRSFMQRRVWRVKSISSL